MKWLKYFLPLFSVIAIGMVALVYFKGFSISAQTTDSHDFQTTVTVGNSAPVFTTLPYSNEEWFNPWAEECELDNWDYSIGQEVPFFAEATDANNENYYLVVCGTDSVIPGTNGGPPTCGGKQYCVSSSTVSGGYSECEYVRKATDPWENPWFAFVCDNNSTMSACSPASQGPSCGGSPFHVNHPPVFTAISNDGPKNPGEIITWTATASDPDGHMPTLEICLSPSSYLGDDGPCYNNWDHLCDDWSQGSICNENAGLTYSYPVPIPTVDTSYNAYVYIVDYMGSRYPAYATGPLQGSNNPYVVNNVAPVVSNVTLNGGSAINLVESSTKAVPVTATVTDNNGCAGGEISSVNAYVYRSGIGYTGCDTAGEANGNHCYPEISCSVGTCSGATATYSCTANLQYYADPTDLGFCATPIRYYSQNWLATVKATDNNSLSGNTTSPGVEVNSLAAFSIPTSLSYGNLSAGGKNDPLGNTLVVTPTGNAPFNVNLSGTNMCTDYPTCSSSGGRTPIGVANRNIP